MRVTTKGEKRARQNATVRGKCERQKTEAIVNSKTFLTSSSLFYSHIIFIPVLSRVMSHVPHMSHMWSHIDHQWWDCLRFKDQMFVFQLHSISSWLIGTPSFAWPFPCHKVTRVVRYETQTTLQSNRPTLLVKPVGGHWLWQKHYQKVWLAVLRMSDHLICDNQTQRPGKKINTFKIGWISKDKCAQKENIRIKIKYQS